MNQTSLALIVLFVGNLHTTSYRSVPNQTDDSPFYTSNGERCNVNGVAVSRDLLNRWGGPLHYGDMLYINGIGWKKVNDVMALRHKKAIDIWVPTYAEERMFAHKWDGKTAAVWVVRRRNAESN